MKDGYLVVRCDLAVSKTSNSSTENSGAEIFPRVFEFSNAKSGYASSALRIIRSSIFGLFFGTFSSILNVPLLM